MGSLVDGKIGGTLGAVYYCTKLIEHGLSLDVIGNDYFVVCLAALSCFGDLIFVFSCNICEISYCQDVYTPDVVADCCHEFELLQLG